MRFVLPTSKRTPLRAQVRSEYVKSDDPGEYAFDHLRAVGRPGVTRYFDGLSSLDFGGFFAGRHVFRSGRLSYLSYGIEGSLVGFHSRGGIDALTRLEIRDYNEIGDPDDYLRLELDARHRWRLSDYSFTTQELGVEATWFDQPDAVSTNYQWLHLAVLGGIQSHDISLGLGPRVEVSREQREEYPVEEDYNEIGAVRQIDILSARPIFATIEDVTGRSDVAICS